ncbi:hypothetical protein [Legionella fairfieldensis]|uniref:hypothetical protein n=1 Tax=Legionella fairfieldensis TaxID=45064 RepID=UPI0010410963|nr:hypothetical protein [Legionella fairfieldensis]
MLKLSTGNKNGEALLFYRKKKKRDRLDFILFIKKRLTRLKFFFRLYFIGTWGYFSCSNPQGLSGWHDKEMQVLTIEHRVTVLPWSDFSILEQLSLRHACWDYWEQNN